MQRELPERVYWALSFYGKNPLIFKEHENNFDVIKDGIDTTGERVLAEIERYKEKLREGFKRIAHAKICLIQPKNVPTKSKKHSRECDFQFCESYPDYKAALQEAKATKIIIGTVTMLSPCVGVMSRHSFKTLRQESDGFVVAYVKASFASIVDGGLETFEGGYDDVEVLDPLFELDDVNDEQKSATEWTPLNDFVFIRWSKPVTEHYFLPAQIFPFEDKSIPPTTASLALAVYGYPQLESNQKEFIDGFGKRWSQFLAGPTEKELLSQYHNLQNIPEQRIPELVVERIEVMKKFVEFDHKAIAFGSKFAVTDLMSSCFIRSRISCLPGMSGGPLVYAHDPTFLFGIASGGYKGAPENYFVPVNNRAFMVGYKKFVVDTLTDLTLEQRQHVDEYLKDVENVHFAKSKHSTRS